MEPRAADQSRFCGHLLSQRKIVQKFCRTQDRGLMPEMVSGFNCSHALPFNIDKRTRGGRQPLRASGGCVPGRRIPAQQAGELRDGEHRAGPAAGVRRQRGTGSLPGAEKHWFARCEARLTLHGVDRLDSRVLRYSEGSYLSGDGRRGRKTLGPRRKDVWLANVSQEPRLFDLCKKPAFDVHGAARQSLSI